MKPLSCVSWGLALSALFLAGFSGRGQAATLNSKEAPMSAERPSREELRQKLTPEQFHVICNEGTEPPFRNLYWDNHEPGIYVDIVSGEPLFSSIDKFDSGTGWPSFTKPLEPENIEETKDFKLIVPRIEVRSKVGGSHLGHLFDDGPQPTGLRYCINSAALRFIPVDQLEAEGNGKYLPLFGRKPSRAAAGDMEKPQTARDVATLAGGCFWGMEEILRQVPGVISTRVGYTGGALANPRYEDLHSGLTGHAEAVEIVFDPTIICFEQVLEKYFFRMHDPTTLNRQGNDVGSQYRSAIFYHSEAQRRIAESVKDRVGRSGKWTRPIVTEIVPAQPFYLAEDDHQKYLERHPGGYTCHYLRE